MSSHNDMNTSESMTEDRYRKFADQINKLAIKTSLSHPINISWIIPDDILLHLSSTLPIDHDLYDMLNPRLKDTIVLDCKALKKKGNLALSSCPGKKVRLSGPVKGRASISRDLNLDFSRMKSLGITMLVCCLYDNELDYLGASWPKYETAAKLHHMRVIRLPMNEGGCPDTIKEVKEAVDEVNGVIQKGESVLVHCRGGVGRAGLFACCWLLENLLCTSVERAVSVLRQQRSPKAVETVKQVEYIITYYKDLRKRLNITRSIPSSVSENDMDSIPYLRAHPFAIPTMKMIAILEYEMMNEQ
ncbi:protein-tyrosine phosphatase-like protein [Pilobolus umbonatus]|nr:protein-tyrosine phosphatase-like protein [Pilobolus umbonatus]